MRKISNHPLVAAIADPSQRPRLGYSSAIARSPASGSSWKRPRRCTRLPTTRVPIPISECAPCCSCIPSIALSCQSGLSWPALDGSRTRGISWYSTVASGRPSVCSCPPRPRTNSPTPWRARCRSPAMGSGSSTWPNRCRHPYARCPAINGCSAPLTGWTNRCGCDASCWQRMPTGSSRCWSSARQCAWILATAAGATSSFSAWTIRRGHAS